MMEQKQQMYALHLGQSLAVAVALSLMLLIGGVIGLGVAMGHSDVVPPDLDVSLSGLRIVAYTTNLIECRPHGLCPGATRYYDVVWVVRETAPDYLHDTWHRVLSVPLQY
jgi:hypothetical protein